MDTARNLLFIIPRRLSLKSVCSIAVAISVVATSQAKGQGPLTPTNALQSPAAPPFFGSGNYLLAPLSAYLDPATNNPYSQFIISNTYAVLGDHPGDYLGSTVTSTVYRDPTNGSLAFEYQFSYPNPTNPLAVTTDLEHLTVNDPSNPWTGVSIFDAGAGPDPNGTSTPAGGTFSWANGTPLLIEQLPGNGIEFDFAVGNTGTILESSTNDFSATMWLATNATNFALSNVNVSDSSTGGISNGYAPATGVFLVPEPSTIGMLLIGIGMAVIGLRYRRRLVAA